MSTILISHHYFAHILGDITAEIKSYRLLLGSMISFLTLIGLINQDRLDRSLLSDLWTVSNRDEWEFIQMYLIINSRPAKDLLPIAKPS